MTRREIKNYCAEEANIILRRDGKGAKGATMFDTQKRSERYTQLNEHRIEIMFDLMFEDEKNRAFLNINRNGLDVWLFRTLDELHKKIVEEWIRCLIEDSLHEIYHEAFPREKGGSL